MLVFWSFNKACYAIPMPKPSPTLLPIDKSLPFRERWRHIIFGTDTLEGQRFDSLLIVCIIASVAMVMLDSVPSVNATYGRYFYIAEWLFTITFTLEYLFRIYVALKPRKYLFSFYGIVDLLAILPSYLSLVITGANYLLMIRLLRVLRIFRVLKLLEYMGEARVLLLALSNARRKITVFMFAVAIMAMIFGSLLYVVEGEANGFTSIPKSIYWAIVTITTVGYGDISPQTPLGQALAALVMLTGYAIIAIPTGIVTAEIALLGRERKITSDRECTNCHKHFHLADAKYCNNCGHKFEEET